jgi:hypothetical protein
MTITSYNFEKYNPAQMAHIARHLEGSNTQGSHFIAGAFPDAKSLVDFAYEQILDYAGQKLVREVDLGRTIGHDSLVALDSLPEGATITQEPRGRIGYLVNIIRGIQKKPTSNMVIVAGPSRDKRQHGFYTIFPGANAPAFPLPKDELRRMGFNGRELKMQLRENETYREFWARHGFVAD